MHMLRTKHKVNQNAMFYYCTIENYLVNKLLSIVGVSTFVDIAFADMEWKREDSDDG